MEDSVGTLVPSYGPRFIGGNVLLSGCGLMAVEHFAPTTTALPAYSWEQNLQSAVSINTVFSLVLVDDGTGNHRPYHSLSAPPADFLHVMGYQGNGGLNGVTPRYSPTTEVPSINDGGGTPVSTVYSATTSQWNIIQGGNIATHIQATSASLVLAGSQLASISNDLDNGKLICLSVKTLFTSPLLPYSQIGAVFGLGDGTNERIWHFAAGDTSPNITEGFYPIVIDPDGGFEYQDNGTITLDNMDRVYIGYRNPTSSSASIYYSPVTTLNTLKLEDTPGGLAGSMLDVEAMTQVNRLNTVQRQGGQSTTQFVVFQPVTIACANWVGDGQSVSLPAAYDEAGGYVQAMAPSGAFPFLFEVPDGGTFSDRNKVYDGGNYNPVGFSAGTSTHISTSYTMQGAAWTRSTPYLNEINGALAGLLIADSKKAVFTVLADCTGGVTFSGCVDSEAIEVASSADFNKLHNCDFLDNSDAAIKLSGNHAAITANGMTFSGNATKMHYTGTTPLTITADANTNLVAGSYPAGTDNSEVRCPNAQVIIAAPTKGITFTGTITGAQIVVYGTGTTTELYRQNASTGSDQWETPTDETVDYTIYKAGYELLRFTGVSVTAASTVNLDDLMSVDREYASGVTFTYGALNDGEYNTGTNTFMLTKPMKVTEYYSAMVDAFIANETNTDLKNQAFPLDMTGDSLTVSDATIDAGDINYLYRGAMRYLTSGVETDTWAGLWTEDGADVNGITTEIQQEAGLTPTRDGWDAALQLATGDLDCLVKVYEQGAFDYRNDLRVKRQPPGYDEGYVNVVETYGGDQLRDRLYVVSFKPTLLGIPATDPGALNITFSYHATPVTWNSKQFSVTIQDNVGYTGEQIWNFINYALSQDGNLGGFDVFNWGPMFEADGSKYKTIQSLLIGTGTNMLNINSAGDALIVDGVTGALQTSTGTGDSLVGIRVVRADGTSAHPDFSEFTSDDGTTYEPPVSISIANTNAPATARAFIYNQTQAAVLFNGIVGAGGLNESFLFGPGQEIVANDIIEIRIGEETKDLEDETWIANASGFNSTVTFTDDAEWAHYNTKLGITGSAVTGYSLDQVEDDINLTVTANFNLEEGYLWFKYQMNEEIGIAEFWRAYAATDVASHELNTTDYPTMKLDNNGTQDVVETSGVSLSTSTGVRPTKSPSTGGYGIHVNIGKVYVKEVNTGAAVNKATVKAAMDEQGLTTTNVSANNAQTTESNKILKNRNETNAATGKQQIYDDDNTTVLLEADAFEDTAGTTPYTGNAINRRDKLSPPA